MTNKPLSERPSEWKMDEFIRLAKDLEDQVTHLENLEWERVASGRLED